jgi:hypothetical protein
LAQVAFWLSAIADALNRCLKVQAYLTTQISKINSAFGQLHDACQALREQMNVYAQKCNLDDGCARQLAGLRGQVDALANDATHRKDETKNLWRHIVSYKCETNRPRPGVIYVPGKGLVPRPVSPRPGDETQAIGETMTTTYANSVAYYADALNADIGAYNNLAGRIKEFLNNCPCNCDKRVMKDLIWTYTASVTFGGTTYPLSGTIRLRSVDGIVWMGQTSVNLVGYVMTVRATVKRTEAGVEGGWVGYESTYSVATLLGPEAGTSVTWSADGRPSASFAGASGSLGSIGLDATYTIDASTVAPA